MDRITDLPSRGRGPARRAPDPVALRLDFPGLSLPVILPEDADLLDGLARVVRGWTPARRPAGTDDLAAPAAAKVTRHPAGYTVVSHWMDEPLDGLGLAATLCALQADLAECWFADRPDGLALHCAALSIGPRLVLLTGQTQAGKSTLSARLSAAPGVAFFCDDVLPVDAGARAVGLGLAARLRLPLPASSPTLAAHFAANGGPSGPEMGFLVPQALVPHGTSARPEVLVQLDRQAGAAARLHALDAGEALALILRRNMSEKENPAAAFAAAERLSAGLTAYRLVYSDLDAAADLIVRDLGAADLPAPGTLGPMLAATARTTRVAPVPPRLCWRRAPGVALRTHGQSAFLWRAGGGQLWQLNPLARIVWTLLEIPGSAAEIAATLAEVYPDQPERRLVRDVGALLAQMQAAGLIRRG